MGAELDLDGGAQVAKVAYEARSGFEGLSGSVQLPNGEAYDVGEALKDGGGKIVLNPDPGERKSDDAQEKENQRAAEERQIAESLALFEGLKTTTVDSPKSSKDGDA
jgi:hypothetical protein